MHPVCACARMLWRKFEPMRLAILPVALSAAVLAACGQQVSRPVEDERPAPDWITYRSAEWGYTVSFPSSWQRAELPVTRITDPREILSLGTFPLRYRATRCEAFAGGVREDLGPSGALLTILERGFDRSSEWLDFPPRPERFGPSPENAKGSEPACGDRPGTDGRWLNFTDAGRHFHALVVFGPDAPSTVRREAWRILNSLRLDLNAKPDWPAGGRPTRR